MAGKKNPAGKGNGQILHIVSSALLIMLIVLLHSCGASKKNRLYKGFDYAAFKDSIKAGISVADDTTNIFDTERFVPGKDSLESLLKQLDTLWKSELLQNKNAEYRLSVADQQLVANNIKELEKFLSRSRQANTTECREKECLLYVEVIKAKQILYLYVEGELVDSFAVSTGMTGYDTPDVSLRPSGPILTRYTSKKFPGGNYEGLGNMPYAIFFKGGYAIHGTTEGNIKKLGSKASHGCIRLHPDNAKFFNELVKVFGLESTWLSIRETD